MSGGYFNSKQYNLDYISDEIEFLIKCWDNKSNPIAADNSTHEETYVQHFEEKTINEFRTAVRCVRMAAVYARSIDYLLSGDDSEKSFHERLKEDLLRYEQ